MSKELVIILGPHAVGKMTVGQELAKLTGLKLFHNHMSIELVQKFFSVHGSEEGNQLNTLIRSETFKAVAQSDLRGLIFTYMFAFDIQSEYDYIDSVISLFRQHGAKCCVVELCADFDERIERNKSENRLANKESKRDIEQSEAEMRMTTQIYRLNSYDSEKLFFENYMKIDNTHLEPAVAAQMIYENFALGEKDEEIKQ
ncbi:MAG TPA: AAA family ATPase [Bacillota bacterium]|nr:AAA family ATPase [Bacillota bacterium]